MTIGVGLSDFDCVRTDVNRGYTSSLDFFSDRDGYDAGTGSDVANCGAAEVVVLHELGAQSDQHLGFRPRNEYAPIDIERPAVELFLADYVCEWFAICPARHSGDQPVMRRKFQLR